LEKNELIEPDCEADDLDKTNDSPSLVAICDPAYEITGEHDVEQPIIY